MKEKNQTENLIKRIGRVLKDYTRRTFLFSSLSFLSTIAFTAYNLFLGIVYHSSWNFGIAIYYALLVSVRAYTLFSERNLYHKKKAEEYKENARKKLFFVQSVFLFLIDFALVVPISLMVLQRKEIHYTAVPAIATAAYTTYKIIVSTKNFIKAKKQPSLSVQILRNINFVDGLVSVLTLQYTMIMTFGSGVEGQMKALYASTSFVIWALLIAISLATLIKSVRLRKTAVLKK